MPTDQHFLPRLLTPSHGLGRIRIGQVVLRVIEVSRAQHLCALGDMFGLREYKRVLPVEIVLRHIEDDFVASIRLGQLVAKRLATNVHVREQRKESHVFLERLTG